TISKRDWSSDVCSSDLARFELAERAAEPALQGRFAGLEHQVAGTPGGALTARQPEELVRVGSKRADCAVGRPVQHQPSLLRPRVEVCWGYGTSDLPRQWRAGGAAKPSPPIPEPPRQHLGNTSAHPIVEPHRLKFSPLDLEIWTGARKLECGRLIHSSVVENRRRGRSNRPWHERSESTWVPRTPW